MNRTVTIEVKQLDRVVIRFAGDSGDGMQLTGDRFTAETASFGNDLSTLPNFPAEIRAPAGTLPGVSSFQLHFADHDILTPGDAPDVLIAMNPAALKANLRDVPRGATLIIDTADFTARNLKRIGYDENPLETGELEAYHVVPLNLTGMTVESVKEFGLTRKDASRAKNMYALGLVSWLFQRPVESTITFLETKFAGKPDIRDANIAAFRAGYNFGETAEEFSVRYEVKPARMATGTYRNISGNLALAYGLVAGAQRAGLPLVLGAYPITPASDVLHELSKLKRFDVTTIQAEDEIAGVGAALGASFGGALGVTDVVRTGDQPEVRDDRSRRDARAAAGRLRHPARRSVDRDADQDRAGRSAAGDVRPQRRGAAAGDRGPVPRGLLRDRGRGDPDRGHLPDAGDGAVRRLPGQRFRAVADPGDRGPADDRPELHHRARTRPTTRANRRTCPTCATRRRWRAPGRSPVRRGSTTASVVWRRRTRPATSPTTRPTTI